MILRMTGVYLNGSQPAAGIVPRVPSPFPISWPRGEAGTLLVSVVDPSGNPVDMTTYSAIWTLRRYPFDEEPLVRRTVIGGTSDGEFAIPVGSGDTSALDIDRYRYDMWTESPASRDQIVRASDWDVLESERSTSDIDAGGPFVPAAVWGSVDSTSDLATLNASGLTDGIPIFVRGTDGGPDGYYHVRIGKGLAEDGVNAIAASGLSGGQWVRGLG
jgi:hypothetical protein